MTASPTNTRIFFTGATGVIGRIAVPKLVSLGYRVTAVGRNPTRLDALRKAGASTTTVDLFDRAELRRAMAGHDVVINLATHIPGSMFQMALPWSWRENDRIRRDASAALADVAIELGIRQFIQESFAPIYEDGGDRWIDESAPVKAVRYNRTVLDAERSARRVTQAGGRGVILRFAFFYGGDATLSEMLSVVRRGWFPLPGRADAYWSSVSHEDAAAAVVAAIGVPAGVYNICDDEPITRRELANVMASAIGEKSPKLIPGWVTSMSGSLMKLLARSQRMSNATFKAATGWSPRWPSARAGLPVVSSRA